MVPVLWLAATTASCPQHSSVEALRSHLFPSQPTGGDSPCTETLEYLVRAHISDKELSVTLWAVCCLLSVIQCLYHGQQRQDELEKTAAPKMWKVQTCFQDALVPSQQARCPPWGEPPRG